MRLIYVYLFIAIAACCQAQNTAGHRSITLPLYEATATNTDPKLFWLDAPLKVGDTIRLGEGQLKLQKAVLSFSTLGEVNEVELKGNVVTKNVATILDDAAGDRSALIILEIDSCTNQKGEAVKSYCNYRLRYQ